MRVECTKTPDKKFDIKLDGARMRLMSSLAWPLAKEPRAAIGIIKVKRAKRRDSCHIPWRRLSWAFIVQTVKSCCCHRRTMARQGHQEQAAHIPPEDQSAPCRRISCTKLRRTLDFLILGQVSRVAQIKRKIISPIQLKWHQSVVRPCLRFSAEDWRSFTSIVSASSGAVLVVARRRSSLARHHRKR
ncbi:hypothetical protein BC828DRAFT_394698 [Blastocladiella britannica]|nr:hypothetical protein BC828DRAFT_394698 [Blastocladiella britannica]